MATNTADVNKEKYYVPPPSIWPVQLIVGMICTLAGASVWLEGYGVGEYVMLAGIAFSMLTIFLWFRGVVQEHRQRVYSAQVDLTFRIGMALFIMSEVFFFGAFFGALFYTHVLTIPWLSGEGSRYATHAVLWPQFSGTWPSNGPANLGGAFEVVPPFRGPLLNTIILLSSSVTVTWAHWGLKVGRRWQVILGQALTLALGLTFLWFQAHEFIEAYTELNLTLGSGIYGSTFFMLTGFHGLHVTLGSIMLAVILLRLLKGHYSGENEQHFGFEAVSWYWHFVDVIWICLFVLVYIL